MDIHDTLAEATGILEAARPRAFGAGAVVDRERLLDLLNHARQSLPSEILSAAGLLAKQEEIIAAARAEAEEIVGTARGEAQSVREAAGRDADAVREQAWGDRDAILADHAVVAEAHDRAAELLARADHQVAKMRAEVDGYVEAKLSSLAATLARALDTVEAGRRKVRAAEPAEELVRAS
jgi:cell division septum initiation protein DivIVA